MPMLTMHRSCLFILALTGFVGSVCAQTDQSVYGDSLGTGWQNWSWATVNLNNHSPVHAGANSISVTAAAYQALYLHHDALDSSAYSNLTFWIHGGPTGGQQLQVQALLNGVAQPAVALAPLPSNTWQHITLSLASLGVTNKPNMDGFWIQDTSGTNKPTFYVDDITMAALPPPSVVHISINATQVVRAVDSRIFGLNSAVWDGVFDTANTIGFLDNMNNQALRFPGGSLADDYHWASNTTDTNTWTWATSFDKFADVATSTCAQVFTTVNYGSGTPTEAASWVQYSNVTKHYGFKYWEIGNENYGSWETDTNALPNDPYTYATRFQAYFNQMKAADSTIKIGAVAVTGEDSFSNYTNHPAHNPRTGQVHNGWTPVLLATLKSLGVTPDFLIYHRYAQAPGAESDAGLLQSSSTWASDAADLRQQLSDYLGSSATNVELDCTENNSVYSNPGKQTTSLVNGLFLADSLGHALQTEFNAVLWWDARNGQETGNNNDPALYGWRQYGDYGITDFADPASPADRYPTFYVAKLLQYFARGGDQIVQATSDYPLLSVYAAKRTNNSVTLLVINKSSTNALNANLSISGYLPATNAVVYSYGIPQDEAARTGIGSADIAQASFTGAASKFSYSFPPYSVSVICLTNLPPPIIVGIVRNGNGSVILTWIAKSNCTYIVQDCGALSNSWQMIGSPTNAGPTNTTLSYTDISATFVTQRFYRVGLVTP
ncbi:MAG TPA: alpha-L-arabinofuranosidase [Verrucomicrobiae bacterium]|nr:alpha-L-arabinofuranosidase [Verrucomicrobiae bacterium]